MSPREMLNRQPQWLVLFETLVLVGLVGWIDYVTGWEWSFFMLYAVPIVLVVWKTTRSHGYAVAIVCAVIWGLAQIDGHPYRTTWGFALAAATRLFYFGVLVIAASAVKTQRELDRAHIASLERTQELEREILRTSEREQQRIGRDLHDGLGPHLAGIGYAIALLGDDLRQQERPEAVKAEKIREMVGEAISLTRGLARGIFPVQMEESGLAIALEDLAGTVSRLSGMSVSFYETGNPAVTDSEIGMHLYRIAQEALNNAAKHGGAKNATVVLSRSGGSIRLVIADDGKGLPPPSKMTSGVGLHSMRYRARSLGGQLEIKSNRDEGTTVSCEIPIRLLEPGVAVS